MKSLIDVFDDDSLIYYYTKLLFPEKESLIQRDERDKICTELEKKYEFNLSAINSRVLSLLISLNSKKGLEWGLEYAESNNKWLDENFNPPALHRCRDFEILKRYFNIVISKPLYNNGINSCRESIQQGFKHIAYSSEDECDSVVAFFTETANNNKGLAYLHRTAEDIRIGYYENLSGVITLEEANAIYNSYA